MGNLTIVEQVMMYASLIVAVVLHEISHGLAALYMGDDTAKRAGRLSLNPIKHVDPIGTIVLPAILAISGSGMMFGWAKPVPINLSKMRDVRKGLWLTAAAGPLMNLALAVISFLLFVAVVWASYPGFTGSGVVKAILFFLQMFISINIVLMLFNLIPIPPLDGSKVLAAFLPYETANSYLSLQRFGFIAVIVMMHFGLFDYVISPAITGVFELLDWAVVHAVT